MERSINYAFVLSIGAGRQECKTAFQGVQLPVHHTGQALHLHNANEVRRWVEPDPVQPGRLHAKGIRNQLH